ncbi:MAG: hypothetical protein P8X74_14980 [Reinekea sp.]|jgi:hypothetical protein
MKPAEHSSLSELYRQHKAAHKAPAHLTKNLQRQVRTRQRQKRKTWQLALPSAFAAVFCWLIFMQYQTPAIHNADESITRSSRLAQPIDEEMAEEQILSIEQKKAPSPNVAQMDIAVPIPITGQPLRLLEDKERQDEERLAENCVGQQFILPEYVKAPASGWFRIKDDGVTVEPLDNEDICQ